MLNRSVVAVCLALGLIVPSVAMAGNNGLGVKASTLGAGIEYERQFNEILGMRLGVNYFQIDSDFDVDDINYDASVDLQSASAVADWYPFAGAFRLTGGIMYNGNETDISATPSRPVTIGDLVFTPQMVGTLQGNVTFNKVSPYAGIGWTNGREKSEGLSIAFDIGVLFQGSPDIENYRATGPLAGNPVFEAELEKEVLKIEDELDSYRYYPVVALTLTYRF
ncbi:MAG: hypothetical protein SCJ94_12395 [Bacillota bacterium]|nr:hypothetical protein [Bacillota bacterium]